MRLTATQVAFLHHFVGFVPSYVAKRASTDADTAGDAVLTPQDDGASGVVAYECLRRTSAKASGAITLETYDGDTDIGIFYT